jgi:hypothetical protein
MRRSDLYFFLGMAMALLLSRTAAAQPANLVDIARSLPPLAREAGTVRLPLTSAEPYAWHPVREGVRIETSRGLLTSSYQVATGKPAGAALVVAPGTLSGLRALKIKTTASRALQLVVALHDAAGVVYAFPATPVRPGNAREAELSVEHLTYLSQASSAPDPGHFDPAGAVMITLLDLSGFFGADTPEVSWTVESLEGVVQ